MAHGERPQRGTCTQGLHAHRINELRGARRNAARCNKCSARLLLRTKYSHPVAVGRIWWWAQFWAQRGWPSCPAERKAIAGVPLSGFEPVQKFLYFYVALRRGNGPLRIARNSGSNAAKQFRQALVQSFGDLLDACFTSIDRRCDGLISLANCANSFARESHIDEIATALARNPVKYRLKHISDVRLRKVLQAAAEQFGLNAGRERTVKGVVMPPAKNQRVAPPKGILVLGQKDVPSPGAGEPPLIRVAPAIANALFNATSIRLIDLPVTRENVSRGFVPS